jgi:hypothetical protein
MTDGVISASVGRGGVNLAADVAIVQGLLIARGFTSITSADGVCEAVTISSIEDYQSAFLASPDGRVDPGGTTWRHLSASDDGGGALPAGGSGLGHLVPKPAADTINTGLVAASNSLMLAAFGQPLVAGNYTSQCQVPTNAVLRRNLVTDTVGPFKVTGLLPAVLSLKEVMADIQSAQPQVYAALGTAGMLCCRLVRGSTTSISNHSWGSAIDLTLDGVLDQRGDDLVQFGLTQIAPIFNRHGWYWGAGFPTEDGMHFEGSAAKIAEWKTQLR